MLTRLTLRMGLLAIPMSFPFELEADDCNQNRVADSKDIEAGRSADCNRNAVPDECDVRPSDFGFTILQSLMPLGEAPLMMVSTDLDGDGNLDLITANFGTWEIKGKTLSILWGKGDGTLESPLILPVRAWPQLVEVGDLDGDKRLDLIVLHKASKDLSIIRNKGARTFQEAELFDVGFSPDSVSAADFDGDQDTDLVVSAESQGKLLVFRNRGDGTFELAHAYPRSGIVEPADFDGDGDLDLALSRTTSFYVSILANSGSADFTPLTRFVIKDAPSNVIIQDLDGNGTLDIVTPAWKSFSVVLNQGRGSFQEAVRYPVETGWTISLSAGDFDRDGNIDLALGNKCELVNGQDCQETLSTFVNDGRGSFSPGSSMTLIEYHAFDSLSSGDINGDGFPDLVMVDPELYSAWIIVNQGNGTFRQGERYDTALSCYDSFASEDWNGDGQRDVAIGCSREIRVLENRGGGTLQLVARYDLPAPILKAADFDNDGKEDLLVATFGESISFLRGRGDGSFEGPLDSTFQGCLSGAPALADFNKDGYLDLALRLAFDWVPACAFPDEALLLFTNNGDGSFREDVRIPLPREATAPAIADFDQDGREDLVFGHRFSGEVSVILNGANGVFLPGANIDVNQALIGVTTADVDSDDKADIIVMSFLAMDSAQKQIVVLLLKNEGNLSFRQTGTYGVGVADGPISVADLDGDGHRDLIATSFVLFNKGDGTFFPKRTKFPGLTLSDLDGDGLLDMVGALETQIVTFKNSTKPPRSADQNRNGVPDECEMPLFHRGDVDSSGHVDVTDAVAFLNSLFTGSGPVPCPDAADSNDDGALNITDAVHLLLYLFAGGARPPPPGPEECGGDPTPDDLGTCRGC